MITHVRARSLSTLLLLTLTPATPACESTSTATRIGTSGQEIASDTARPSTGELDELAIRAIREGRLDEARELLDELLGETRLQEARAQFAAGNPQDGLIAIDRALEARPGHPESLLTRAEGSLQLAEEVVAGGGGALFAEGAFQDALAAYRAVPMQSPATGVRVLFGASRAAFFLGQSQEALDYARQGMTALEEVEAVEGLASLPERTWAEASFLAYREARNAANTDDSRALFFETRDALERLLARTPDDAWVWTQLARLQQWEGNFEEATRQLQSGLDHLPHDTGLLQTLVEVSGAGGGTSASLEALDTFAAAHPSVALGPWYRARVRFDDALARLLNGDLDPDAFSSAEADFVRCREMAAEHTDSCKAYEVMCRDALGWCHYNKGEYEGARDAFLSMEEVFDGGLEWAMEGQLLSGVQGLEFVAQAFSTQADWAAAAEVFEGLRALRPEEAKWANNAGFFHRDAGVPLELVGRRLCQASSGEALPDDLASELERVHPEFENTPDDCKRLATLYLDKAREHMRRSYDAYLDASRLAPTDVRIVNDTALIAVYYLHEDLGRAEQMLRDSIAMGTEQLATRELDAEERFALENAYGDALQNLAVLMLWQRRDRDAARQLLERCLPLGDPRAFVKDRLLPLCDASEEELAAAEDQGLRAWAQPCE